MRVVNVYLKPLKQGGKEFLLHLFLLRILSGIAQNESVHVAVVGISGNKLRVRGIRHVQGYGGVPNVKVTTLCDVDERLCSAVVGKKEDQ